MVENKETLNLDGYVTFKMNFSSHFWGTELNSFESNILNYIKEV